MPPRLHLPLATVYQERDALKDVRDNALDLMVAECEYWTMDMDRFRTALVTPAALVLWRVLIASERSLVADALARVVEEISNRKLVGPDDAVPAPGEDLQILDHKGTASINDEHASTEKHIQEQ